MYFIGIDSGSTTTKGVVVKENKVIQKHIVPTGIYPDQSANVVLNHLIDSIDSPQVRVVATGYGRELIKEADKIVTEITCHGKGAFFLSPGVKGVIDIGGQDSKVMVLNEDGMIQDFMMNDKCAAGTGRFLEVMLKALQIDILQLDQIISDIPGIKISSMCTVFAESEVISQLSNNIPPNQIARAVVESICRKTTSLAKKIPMNGNIFFSGGLSKSRKIVDILGREMGQPLVTHPDSQFTGAIGAAIMGKTLKKNK